MPEFFLISLKDRHEFINFNLKKRTNTQLLEDLRADDHRTDVALKTIYQEYFPLVRKLVLQKGGTEEHSKDIFQESIIGLMHMIRRGQYRGDASLKTVIYAIARNLWNDHLRKNKETEDLFEISETKGVEMDIPSGEELAKKRLLRTLFAQLSPDCQKVISLYYYQNWTMEMICEEMGFANPKVARNKKYKCLQRLIGIFKENNIDQQRFE